MIGHTEDCSSTFSMKERSPSENDGPGLVPLWGCLFDFFIPNNLVKFCSKLSDWAWGIHWSLHFKISTQSLGIILFAWNQTTNFKLCVNITELFVQHLSPAHFFFLLEIWRKKYWKPEGEKMRKRYRAQLNLHPQPTLSTTMYPKSLSSGVARAFLGGLAHPGAKMRKKISKVWRKIRKLFKMWGKNEESGNLAHLGLWGWLRPCGCLLHVSTFLDNDL